MYIQCTVHALQEREKHITEALNLALDVHVLYIYSVQYVQECKISASSEMLYTRECVLVAAAPERRTTALYPEYCINMYTCKELTSWPCVSTANVYSAGNVRFGLNMSRCALIRILCVWRGTVVSFPDHTL